MFSEWNKGELDSFLIEITANILKFTDEDGQFLNKMVLNYSLYYILNKSLSLRYIIYLYFGGRDCNLYSIVMFK